MCTNDIYVTKMCTFNIYNERSISTHKIAVNFFCAIEFYSLLLFSECWIFAMTYCIIMIEASVTCINTYYARARARARRQTYTRSDLAVTGLVPERVQLTVHTTKPTGTVPEPFHCDHIARWSVRTGTSGRSGTGLNTGNWNGSGTVLVSNLWCEHGLIEIFFEKYVHDIAHSNQLHYQGDRSRVIPLGTPFLKTSLRLKSKPERPLVEKKTCHNDIFGNQT